MSWFSNARDLIRALDGLTRVEDKHGALIENLRNRVLHLEAREAVLVAEAKAAASAAASAVSAQHIGDLARRIGVLEEQMRQNNNLGQKRRLTKD